MLKPLIWTIALLLLADFSFGQRKADYSLEALVERYEKSAQFEKVLIKAFADSSFAKVSEYYDSIAVLGTGGSYRSIKLTLLAYEKLASKTTDQNQLSIYDLSSAKVLETGIMIYGRSSMNEEYTESELLNDKDIGVHTKVDNLPQPINGFKGFYKYISKTLKYPPVARKNKVEGKVFVAFVVTKTGAIEGVTIAQGIGSGCDAAARQVIMKSPDWIPGSLKSGEKVNVRMILPITFALSKKKKEKTDS